MSDEPDFEVSSDGWYVSDDIPALHSPIPESALPSIPLKEGGTYEFSAAWVVGGQVQIILSGPDVPLLRLDDTYSFVVPPGYTEARVAVVPQVT